MEAGQPPSVIAAFSPAVAVRGEQARVDRGHEIGGLDGELLVVAGRGAQGDLHGGGDRVDRVGLALQTAGLTA